jgi:hypothetical protein
VFLVAILKMADILKIWKMQKCSSNGDLSICQIPTLKNFYQSPFSKWSPQYRKNSTLSDIIKMMSRIDSQMTNSELDFLRYCGGHFENGDR